MAVITLGGVTLPGDLFWSDEFQGSPVLRSATQSLSGALIVQEGVKLAGRSITLEGKSGDMGYVWLERSTLLAVKALADTAGWNGPLTLADGRTFTVAFRETGLTADPVILQVGTVELSTLPYTFTLQLQTI